MIFIVICAIMLYQWGQMLAIVINLLKFAKYSTSFNSHLKVNKFSLNSHQCGKQMHNKLFQLKFKPIVSLSNENNQMERRGN